MAVYKGMMGAIELLTDEGFLIWVERQSEAFLAQLSTYDLYKLYKQESA